MRELLLFLFISHLTLSLTAQNMPTTHGMTLEKMDSIFQIEAQEVDKEEGSWQLFYQDRLLFVLTAPGQNRMRIFTPISAEEELELGEEKILLEANFHTALDAKYSLYNGFIISVFTHPLKELTAEQLIDALRQVALLADNYGTTYSSTGLFFGFGDTEEAPAQKNIPEKRINQKPQKKN